MNRFLLIAWILTGLTAVLGILTATELVPWWVVAIAGVCAGLWWAFGQVVVPNVADRPDAARLDRPADR